MGQKSCVDWEDELSQLSGPAPHLTRLDILFYRSYKFRTYKLIDFEGIIANSVEKKDCCNSDDKQVVEREIRNNGFEEMTTRALKTDLLTFFNFPAQFRGNSIYGKWS